MCPYLLIELVGILEVSALGDRAQRLDELRRPRHGHAEPLDRPHQAGQADGGGGASGRQRVPPVGRVRDAPVRHPVAAAAVTLFERVYLLRIPDDKDSVC